MTSQINPADIDGNYPIAGVSNNTQGMRDNFTNTRTNFQYASDEITDLQNNVVLKAALLGTTLDNNLGNNVVYNALVKGISGTVVAIANTSGTITIDCSAGPYQSINMAGNIALSFTSNTWPTAGTLGMLRTQITVDQVGRTLTLPNTVSNGIVGIQGYSSNVITFANTGTYEFGFSTTNAGNAITIVDFNRPLNYYTNDVTMAGNLTVSGTITNSNITGTTVSVSGNITGANIIGIIAAGANTITTSGAVTFSATTDSIGIGNSHTTGALVIGGAAGTGAMTIGRSTATQTTHIQGGITSSGNTKTINIGTGGLAGSTTTIALGPVSATTAAATVTFNTATVVAIGNTSGTALSVAGNVTGGNILSSAVVSAVGAATILSGTAVSAGGTAGAGYKFSSTANLGVFFGSGAPTLSAAKGSLYLRTDGTTTNNRMYVNTDGSTTWTAVTTAA